MNSKPPIALAEIINMYKTTAITS